MALTWHHPASLLVIAIILFIIGGSLLVVSERESYYIDLKRKWRGGGIACIVIGGLLTFGFFVTLLCYRMQRRQRHSEPQTITSNSVEECSEPQTITHNAVEESLEPQRNTRNSAQECPQSPSQLQRPGGDAYDPEDEPPPPYSLEPSASPTLPYPDGPNQPTRRCGVCGIEVNTPFCPQCGGRPDVFTPQFDRLFLPLSFS